MPPHDSREMLAPGINNMLYPDSASKRSYGLHVRMRTEMFCYLLHHVANLCLKYQVTRPYEDYLSDKAEVQVGTGLRFAATATTDKLSIDAAHFCNTSFRADALLHHVHSLGKSAADLQRIGAYCNEVKTISASTSFQLQRDNVGPDKIIDSYQTEFKNWFLKTVKAQQKIPTGRETYSMFVTELAKVLSGSQARSVTNPAASGYPGAMAAQDILDNIDLRFLSWSVEEEFDHIRNNVAKLP